MVGNEVSCRGSVGDEVTACHPIRLSRYFTQSLRVRTVRSCSNSRHYRRGTRCASWLEHPYPPGENPLEMGQMSQVCRRHWRYRRHPCGIGLSAGTPDHRGARSRGGPQLQVPPVAAKGKTRKDSDSLDQSSSDTETDQSSEYSGKE
jgi:hypothetical protein